MLRRIDLRGYQRRAVDFIKANPCCGLFVDMGLGKTVSTLTASLDLLNAATVTRILIVAPLRPAQGVWRQEARKWLHTKHLTFKLLLGDERQRLAAMGSTAQIHIINPENLVWLLQVLKSQGKRKPWPYDMLIVDESSMFKTPGAKRFKSLRHVVKRFTRRVILTGTPAPKGLLDLWSQVFLLDEGERLGEQYSRYRSRFFSASGYMGYTYEPDDDAEEKITALISPLILSLRAEDWLDLPPVIKDEVYVDLPPRARAQYKKLEDEMFLEMEKGTTEALSAASLSSKCWQMANGFLYLDDDKGERTWQTVHDAKLDALEEILDGTGENVLVPYWFKPDIARLKKRYPKAPNYSAVKGKPQERLEREWNDGKHKLMFLHPASAGHGSNLQYGGNTMVFFSMCWGREAYAQVCERMGASRQAGLRDNVRYTHILARDTVDDVMLAVQRSRHCDERRAIKLLKDFQEMREVLK